MSWILGGGRFIRNLIAFNVCPKLASSYFLGLIFRWLRNSKNHHFSQKKSNTHPKSTPFRETNLLCAKQASSVQEQASSVPERTSSVEKHASSVKKEVSSVQICTSSVEEHTSSVKEHTSSVQEWMSSLNDWFSAIHIKLNYFLKKNKFFETLKNA